MRVRDVSLVYTCYFCYNIFYMAKIAYNKIKAGIRNKISSDLLLEFNKIKSINDLDLFFRKLFTESEKEILFRRLAAIELINSGKKYKEIKSILNVSDNTISKAKDIMAGRGYGRNPGRKIKYSEIKNKKVFKKFHRKYKGATSILDLI